MIYDFKDYRDFLNAWIESQPGGGHGLRRKIADELGCQGAFVSQVLHKVAQFSLEHGYQLTEFLKLNTDEADFFILLMLYQRAGSEDVRGYFFKKIEAVLQSRLVLKNRIAAKSTMTSEDQSRYYSAWYYAAIHMLVMIPEFQTEDRIAKRLKLSRTTVSEVLEFLIQVGLVKSESGKLELGEAHLHLASDSPLIAQHHNNWRLQAMKSLAEPGKGDLHYSLSVTLSRSDVQKVKAQVIDFIAKLQDTVRPSPSETLCGFCLDWFEA